MIVSSLIEFEFCFESIDNPTETTNRHFIHGFRDDTPLFPFPASLHSTPLLLPHSTYKRSKWHYSSHIVPTATTLHS